MTPETTRYRFTVEELQQADRWQEGFCLACRTPRECCEPDASAYRCDECCEHAVPKRRTEKWSPVFGVAARLTKARPHWIAIAGLFKEGAA
jgi:hypothetical protein